MGQGIALVGSVIVSAMGAIFGLYQARKADNSATTSKTIEIGVKDLVDQYRERNEELISQVHNCDGRCSELEDKIEVLQRKVGQLEASIDNKDAEIIRLKRKAGEEFV